MKGKALAIRYSWKRRINDFRPGIHINLFLSSDPIRGEFFFRDVRHIEVFSHCSDRVKDDLITLEGIFE